MSRGGKGGGKPDFFLIGAPKCGTTAFSEYLRSNPAVFFSDPKELNFFNSDMPDRDRTESLEEYLRHFRGADGFAAAGEGSAWYLYSRVAVPNILRFNPSAKLIVMLRNPVEMAEALHSQNVWDREDDAEDFEKAWRLQGARKRGERLPPFAEEPWQLQYGEICKLGAQMRRLYQNAPRSQVLAVLLEDMKRDARGAYEGALRFLGVPSDGRAEFPPINERKRLRSAFLGDAARLVQNTKRKLGIRRSFGVLTAFRELLTVPKARPQLRPEFRRELSDYFRDDTALLGELLGRDLSHWTAA